MIFIAHAHLQEYLDSLDEAEKVVGNFLYTADGVYIDQVPEPGQ